jgi:exonuclease III
MKILTWNCNLNFSKDYSAINRLGADILFIQECEKLPRDNFEGFDFHWIGNNNKKGLGVLTKGPSEFLEDLYRPDFVYFQPVVFQEFHLLGVWAFNGRAQKFGEDKSGYFLDALDHYVPWIKTTSKVIIAGDFNNGPAWDVPGHRNNFVEINTALNELGLHSAYHQSKSEAFGNESQATHFHQRNPDKPFHIDYIYSDLTLSSPVEVGSFAEWSPFSDHVPLMVDFG